MMRALVVGAGPGGATAALALARGGAEVTLVEKSSWPRDKTCGDGISPLGVREGVELGVDFEGAVQLRQALVSSPHEVAFRGGWPAALPWGTTVERRAFDARIVAAAVAAGAHFLPATEVRAIEPGRDSASVTFVRAGAAQHARADVVVLAEGATGALAGLLGFGAYRSRLIAIRGYVAAPHGLEPEYGIFYDRPIAPGYGWIFPMTTGKANVGVLVDDRVLARCGANLRNLLTRWLAESRFARRILGDRPSPVGVRGGIIPSGRRVRARGRVFLVGDAAGVADPFTAEGIFQAVRSARLAAHAILSAPDVACAGSHYESALEEFDRNERAARFVRATFGPAMEVFARHAKTRRTFADDLNTRVFFPKRSFAHFVWGLVRHW